MLCPEVWNFKEPGTSFQISKIKPALNKPNKQLIDSLQFNHLVSIVIPDTLRLPESVTGTLKNDNEYYKVCNLRVSELVKQEFIANFIRNGNLTLLSTGTRIDCDNCVSVNPSGHLILNVNKNTYQKLGVEGKLSHFSSKNKERYVIKIDLAAEETKATKTKNEKLKSSLEQQLDPFDVIVLWEPNNGKICPSSIAKYFHDLGYATKLCQINYQADTLYSIKAPVLDPDHLENFHSFLEWLGMVSVGADLSEDIEEYISCYETPAPSEYLGQMKVLKCQGLFSCTRIFKMLEELEKFFKDQEKSWASLYVQGFSDSPESWNGEEHHYYTNGDNSYLVLLSKENYLLYKQCCSKKKYK